MARHVDDLLLIKDWIEQLDDLRRIADGDPRVREATRDAETWFLEVAPEVADAVFALAPRAGRKQAAIRAALEF